uniref:DH domain-containing protein n=1 Tax=Vannella robusta TaxID=1487602 RepID=A0A7S4M3F6_9EUKA|mmetsp:Transcript_10064/g.12386  ORF Transcript_10064/g.12386 Transcript_10064/m.12386 type:complete len:475 (+) Transcript_10064:1-1425(+)
MATAEQTKMHAKRRQVAKELLSTEETYVKNLQDLMKVFCEPMEANAMLPENQRVISKDDVRTIFGSLKIILPINKMLLEDLKAQLAVPEEETIFIGASFKNMAFCLRSYISYCTEFDVSRKILQQLKQNPEFVSFFEKLHNKDIIGKMTLKDFLIMPVQRVPRYRMLLTEILKNTWDSHEDYSLVKEALENVSITAQAIEDAQEKFDNMNKIIAIQADLKQNKKEERLALLQPDRKFVRSDVLMIREVNSESDFHKRKLLLFNDLLLVTKASYDSKKKREILKLMSCVYLAAVNDIVVTSAGGQPSISIFSGDTIHMIRFSDETTRDTWFQSLRESRDFAIEKEDFKQQGKLNVSTPKPTKKKKTRKSTKTNEEVRFLNPLLALDKNHLKNAGEKNSITESASMDTLAWREPTGDSSKRERSSTLFSTHATRIKTTEPVKTTPKEEPSEATRKKPKLKRNLSVDSFRKIVQPNT